MRAGAGWGPRSDRRRILVEAPEDQWGFVARWARSRLAGRDVIVCGGPEATPDCPVLQGEPCPLAEEADAVVAGLELDPPPGSEDRCGLRSGVSPAD